MDTVAAALCGIGAALLVGGGLVGRETLGLLMLGAAFYGMHRVLRTRAPLWLIAGLVAEWFFERFWSFVPDAIIKSDWELSNAHPTLHAAPTWLAGATFTLVLVASVVIARSRIGMGLSILTLGAFGAMVLAKGALLLSDKESSAHIVLEGVDMGWSRAAFDLTALSWLAVAVGPTGVAPLPRRVSASIGAAGAALLCAVLTGMPTHAPGGHEAVIAFPTLALALGWVLSAVGLGGFARAGGGGLAWVGMGLTIVQVLALPFGLAIGESVGQQLAAGLGVVLSFGLLGLGLGAVAAPQLDLRAVRGLAGVLFVVAVFGATLALLLVFVSARRILHVPDPFWSLHTFMLPAAGAALALWAACLAYLVAPPVARPAADAAMATPR